MSGLEVVGVVLGAIPLIIHAIDKYKTTSQRLKFFRYKEPFIVQLIQSLEEQKFFIETDLYVVLRSADLDEEKISYLFACPDLSLFDDLEVTEAVQDYLGDGYHRYIAAIARCKRNLEEIAGNLRGLASDSQDGLSALVKANPSSNGSYEFTRKIKFSLEKDELERRIKELNDSTERLRHLREYSMLKTEVTLTATSRTIVKLTSTLNVIREHAQRLYSAVSRGYAGHCHTEHETRLFLHSRSAVVDKKRVKRLKKEPATFQLAFPLDQPSTKDSNLCLKSEVKVLEKFESNNDTTDDGPDQVRRTVSINLPDPPTDQSPQPIDIQDLCGYVAQAQETGRYLSLCLSHKGSLCWHQFSQQAEEEASAPLQEPAKVISLDQRLENAANSVAGSPKWTMNQRMALSFNIASSLIQLQSTSWLCAPLTSKSVCFEVYRDDKTEATALQYTEVPKPFLIHRFTRKDSSTKKYGSSAKRSMLELGIILLELWHNRAVDSFAAETKMVLDDTFGSRYEVAHHWLQLSAYHVLPFYLDPITRCIECTFATSLPTADWQDSVFRKSVGEYVLKPLWENCPAEFR